MKRKTSSTPRQGIPARFRRFGGKYPEVMRAYELLGAATQQSGPLEAKQRALVKLAIAIGAGHQGAVHSHTRRALAAGCTAEELRHVVILATTTVGFPNMMAALSWVEDVVGEKD